MLSSSSMSATTAARNGWRLAKSDARDGPTRSIAVNQRRFVRTSGPMTAKAKPIHTNAPKSKLWSPIWCEPTASSGTDAAASSTALSRNGEYRRIRGAIATEYPAQVSEPSTASPSPFRSADRLPPEPSATSATPAKETSAASQNRRLRCSTPLPRAKSAVKIGSVPNRSATVVAVVNFSAYTKLSWFTKRTIAQKTTSQRTPRPIASDPSQASVISTKMTAAQPYRNEEYASG